LPEADVCRLLRMSYGLARRFTVGPRGAAQFHDRCKRRRPAVDATAKGR
jgi:hypothetical protein